MDKLIHAVEYGVLCFLVIRALRASFPALQRGRTVIIAVIFTVLYGATDEIHQMFVPGRCSSLFDLSFDFLGALITGLIKR